MTSPKTTVHKESLLPSGGGSSRVFHSLHSSATGLCATLGALTSRDAAGLKPASLNSSISGPTAAELIFIADRNASVAIEQVNSPDASMFLRLSLRPPDEKTTIGGLSLTALKKL